MKYPALIIDLHKIKHNTKVLADQCKAQGIQCAAVTKVFCGIPQVGEAMVDGGAYMLADSRVENIKKLKNIPAPKMLLRIPMLSQVEEVVDHVDISLNSEYETIKALSEKALEKGKVHNIILMVDLGDLREGVWREEAIEFAGRVLDLKGVKLYGLGTNLTCYGGVVPSGDNLGLLSDLAEQIEKQYSIELEIISGGNSSSLHMVFKNQMPAKINQLRLGESVVLGRETAFGERIENTHSDAFLFAAEVVEIKEKPSVPIGEIGMDAFGQKPVFTDKGMRKRAILSAGRQDVRPDAIIPRDKNITILGASSDHLIIDVTDCEAEYKVGDIIEFELEYGGLMAVATSEYVYKHIVGGR